MKINGSLKWCEIEGREARITLKQSNRYILVQSLSGKFSFSPHIYMYVLFQRLVLYKNYNMSEEDHTLDELLFLPGTKTVMFQLINIFMHIYVNNK